MKEDEKINKMIDKKAEESGLKIGHVEMPKKPTKIGYTQKVGLDMTDLYLNPTSVLHCAKCEARLGVLHTLRSALFKKPGTSYIVICKRCKHPNVRVKGAYKMDVEKRWSDLQDQLNVKRKP